MNTSASSGGQVLFESLWESMIGFCEIRGGKVSLPRGNSNFPLSFDFTSSFLKLKTVPIREVLDKVDGIET